MKLSAPIFRLKRKARLMSRDAQIPHHQALDAVAREEGFDSWSLLAARYSAPTTGRRLIDACGRGDLVLLGARPGHGKTQLALETAVAAMQGGDPSYFFSLEYGPKEIGKTFTAIGEKMADYEGLFEFDCSDDICAAYIIDRLGSAPSGTVVIVDYLQLLDQKRSHPELAVQIADLKGFAGERGLILFFVSQIHRDFDPVANPLPRLADVRLPNPVNLDLFSRACFLHEGEIELAEVAPA